jgi:hypothetical protein
MRPNVDDALIRSYLLGTLPEPEAEAVEEEYLARPAVLEHVRAVEDDLLDDYAAGRLAPHETQFFEARYLVSPRLRERVVAARALRLAALPGPQAVVRRPWAMPLALAATAVLALVAGLWLGAPASGVLSSHRDSRVETPEPQPTAVAESPPAPAASPPRALPVAAKVVFALSPLHLRGPQAQNELRLPPDARAVVLELEGDASAAPPDIGALEAVLATVEGERLWRGQAPPRGRSDRPELVARVELDAERLAPGDYLLTLFAAGEPDEALSSYFLRVRPR